MRLSESNPSDDGRVRFNVEPKVLAFFDIDDIYTLNLSGLYVYGETWTDKLTEDFDINLKLKDEDLPKFINRGMLIHEIDGIKLYFIEGKFGMFNETAPSLYLVNESDKDAYFTLDNMTLETEERISNCKTWTAPGQRSAYCLSYDFYSSNPEGYVNKVLEFNIIIHYGDREYIREDFSVQWVYDPIA